MRGRWGGTEIGYRGPGKQLLLGLGVKWWGLNEDHSGGNGEEGMDSGDITKVALMRHGNDRIQEAREKPWGWVCVLGTDIQWYHSWKQKKASFGDWYCGCRKSVWTFGLGGVYGTFIWRLQMPADVCWARNQSGGYLGINHLHVIVNIPSHRCCLNILQNVVLFYASMKRVQFITSLLTLFNLHKLDFPRVRIL